jgi:hypothetical protein
VTLMETVIGARWILQSGQCASCGVGVVDDPAALDLGDEERLICIRYSESDAHEGCGPCPKCGLPMIDDGEWLA